MSEAQGRSLKVFRITNVRLVVYVFLSTKQTARLTNSSLYRLLRSISPGSINPLSKSLEFVDNVTRAQVFVVMLIYRTYNGTSNGGITWILYTDAYSCEQPFRPPHYLSS